MLMTKDKCVFFIKDLLKQTKRGKHVEPLEYLAYSKNVNLCILVVLKEYIRRTDSLRGNEDKLLISYQKPHKRISKDTLARWLRAVMERSGIDTVQFGAHSTRMASTSAAAVNGLPIATLMKAAGWSSESTFARFYKKTPMGNLGQTLLDSFVKK